MKSPCQYCTPVLIPRTMRLAHEPNCPALATDNLLYGDTYEIHRRTPHNAPGSTQTVEQSTASHQPAERPTA
jgi:hypothetical protein